MTKPRTQPKNRFHVFIVEAETGFRPTNWRQTPLRYRIVSYAGAYPFKGPADAEKFLHNHQALKDQRVDRWAICLDLFESVENFREAASIERGNLNNPNPEAFKSNRLKLTRV